MEERRRVSIHSATNLFMEEQVVTCPYCGVVLLNHATTGILEHAQYCVPVLHGTTYVSPDRKYSYRWMPLHGWRFYRGARVMEKATIGDVTTAVANLGYTVKS